VFDYATNRQFDDDKIVQITFWDSASHHECKRLRYLESQAILIIFSVDSPESLENVREKVRAPLL
jgi:GTPase SAR1 family protein